MKDIVAELPEEIAQYKYEHGNLPENLEFEPGFICVWDNRYFIHTRETLPLLDIEEGIGFGLWVEVTKSEYERYLVAGVDDTAYMKFKTDGILANQWPGFQNILGVPVVVRAIKPDEKVYIIEVKLDKQRDPLFEVALLAQKNDFETKEKIRNLVKAYLPE
jgi:hypothetical protein